MYRLIGVCFFLIVMGQPFAQTVELPTLLPASPEPTAFVKDGVGNVNLSTGAGSAKIPLYDIKIRDFSFPLSLSYTTQGLKADEATSRVGYGWVLNATGMITRIVRGKPDEYAGRLTTLSDYTSSSSDVYNYDNNASDPNSGFDTQPDEFQFNFNGYSGKFVLDNNYVPRVTSTSNLKIAVQITVTPGSTAGNIGTIIITAPDGVIYHFGTAYEVTTTHNIQGYTVYKDRTKTAFFLDNIQLPTGETVTFNYTPIHIRVSTGKTQTLQVGHINGIDYCSVALSLTNYSTQENRVEYNTNYLTGITTSNGLAVNLTYAARPDLSYDNRLIELDVQGSDAQPGSETWDLKKYKFEYYDVPGSSDPSTAPSIIGRFFLTKVRDMKLKDIINAEVSHDYSFTYQDLANVPLPLVGGQDYYGYYNANTSVDLIPPTVNSSNTIDFSYRNPLFTAAVKGALIAVQYPTGGKEEYIYEGNTQVQQVPRNTMETISLSGDGGTSAWAEYNSENVTLQTNQSVTLQASAADAILDDSYTADPTHPTATVYIYEGTTIIASRTVLGYTPTSITVSLLGGHTYYVKLVVRNATEIGYGSMTYDAGNGQPVFDLVTAAVPGIRIKQIKYTDPVSLNTHSKYYTYAALESLGTSSGATPGIFFKSTTTGRQYCGQYYADETDYTTDIYSSNSTNDIYNIAGSGSVMYYQSVIESDDPNFVNGGTQYLFAENDNGGNHTLLTGEEIPFLSAGQYPSLSGTVIDTRVFDNQKSIVHEQVNEYETLIDLSNSVSSLYVRKKWSVNIGIAAWHDAFDVEKMLYGNYWIRLKSQTETIYSAGSSIINKTSYGYGDPVNILPATVTTTDSRNIQLVSEKKYPNTYTLLNDNDPSGAGYGKLITKNVLTPVVLESSYKNGNLLKQKQVLYKDWFNDNSIVQPQIIQLKASPSDVLHNELLFGQYDNTGNINEVNKVNDLPMTYLWDKVHGLPLCEVKNATADQVAFSNFEVAGEYGGWQLVSGTINTSAYFTGTHSFTGTLSKTPAASGGYVVSLWTNTSAFVNGTAGSLIKQVNGWSLYEWKLSTSTITVSGINIDDVRLFPSGAFMTTFSYKAFIGVTSKSDVNNYPTTYEYDGFNRLSLIRDQDMNIVKKICYNYAGQPEDCYVGAYCSSFNCSGPDKKCINGSCQTGIKVYTASVKAGDYFNCTYHYEFSDGSWSSSITEFSLYGCISIINL